MQRQIKTIKTRDIITTVYAIKTCDNSTTHEIWCEKVCQMLDYPLKYLQYTTNAAEKERHGATKKTCYSTS